MREKYADQAVGREDSTSWARALLFVSIFCIAPALSFWATNAPRGASGWKLLGIAAGTACLGIVALIVINRFLALGRAAGIAAVGVFVMSSWQTIGDVLPDVSFLRSVPGDFVAFAIASVFIAVVLRMGGRREFGLAAFVMAGVIIVPPLAGLSLWYLGDAVQPPIEPTSAPLLPEGRGDVFLVVVDGYARADVLRSMFSFELDSDVFERHGLQVIADARTGYSSTVASISSMLAMSHVGTEGTRPTDRERVALHGIMGGANPVVEAFTGAGYEYVHIESGWDGTRCGKAADLCLDAGYLDEALGILIERSIFSSWFQRRFGSALTVNGLRALDDLRAVAESESQTPRFVFAHIPLPHPPMFLNGNCELVADPEMAGLALGSPGLAGSVTLERRIDAYLQQIECVNLRLEAFLAAVGDSDIVIITGDHGSDSAGQILLQPGDWSADAVYERMSVFTALRLPGCHAVQESTLMLPDLFRIVFACLTGEDPIRAHPEMYIYPVDSSPGVVTELDYRTAVDS
jgi:hypothetical protein